MSNYEQTVEVLARHWRQSTGMTYGSPDRCACGVETFPLSGESDVTDRRARAFAGHQARMLLLSGGES